MGISQYPFGSQGNLRRKRNCLHEIATAPLGPRNDKPLAFTILMTACSLQRYSAGSGMPLPYKAYTIDDSATGFIACMAFRERRYPPFFGGCRFNGGRYRASVPFRDCTPRALPRASRSGRHGRRAPSQWQIREQLP